MIPIGVVGAGKRTRALFKNIEHEAPERIVPAIVFDPSEENRQRFREEVQGAGAVVFASSVGEVVSHPGIRALFIGSPNHTHAEVAEQSFGRGLPTFLEKPVCISREECGRLWSAYCQGGRPPVTVGFVLRYSPFFQRVFEIVQSGQLGQVLSVDSDEQIGASTTALFWEGWRTQSSLSGGLMVEKCSHDFDYLARLVGARPGRVHSAARRTHLCPETSVRHARFDSLLQKRATDAGQASPQTSIYDMATDNPDHQSVLIEWENGVLSTFSVAFGQPRNSRRIRIMGSMGDLEGDAEKGTILVRTQKDPGWDTEETRHDIVNDGTPHHGGDSVIRRAFWSMLAGKPDPLQAGLREGIESVAIGLAAQESGRTGQPVKVNQWLTEIFGT